MCENTWKAVVNPAPSSIYPTWIYLSVEKKKPDDNPFTMALNVELCCFPSPDYEDLDQLSL